MIGNFIVFYVSCSVTIYRKMIEQVKNGRSLFQLAIKEEQDKVLFVVECMFICIVMGLQCCLDFCVCQPFYIHNTTCISHTIQSNPMRYDGRRWSLYARISNEI